MRILLTTYVVNNATSGVVKYLQTLQNALQERGHSVQVLTPFDAPRWVRLITGALVRTASLFGRKAQQLAIEIGSFVRMYFGARTNANSPDIIHGMDVASGTAAKLATGARIPVLVTAHFSIHPLYEMMERDYQGGTAPWAFRWLFQRFFLQVRNYIAPSQFSAKCVQEHAGARALVRVIPHGIDLEPEESWKLAAATSFDGGKQVILTVGRLDKLKNHMKLLDVAEESKGSAVVFAIVGDGPQEACLKAEIKRRQLEGKVLLLGNRNDVPALMHASRLYMYVAKCESFGYTIIEAMSAGLPVLTSRAGAVVEILSGGLEECLFDLADSPAAIWARAKEMLAEDGPRRSVIEKQRRILLERHSMQGMIDKTEEFYRELVEARNDRLNHE